MKHIPLILAVLLWTPASLIAQNQQPGCPNRGVDPSTFCPFGSTWSEENKNVWAWHESTNLMFS